MHNLEVQISTVNDSELPVSSDQTVERLIKSFAKLIPLFKISSQKLTWIKNHVVGLPL